MSGGVYGGGELASGFRLPSLSRPHRQPCTPNPRDLSSGHPRACHRRSNRFGSCTTPTLVLPSRSLARTGFTLHHPTHLLPHPPSGPFFPGKESGLNKATGQEGTL